MIFCTLFDSYYLDRGIILYKSLEKVTDDFKLYIFAFDDRSYEILKEMNFAKAIIIHHSEFETKELLKLKSERTKAEYCWTCTPVIINHVLTRYDESDCTYIDADMYFFSDPKPLFDEIYGSNADIVITPHRFSNSLRDRRLCKRSGKYCVEFNFFNQSLNAKDALTWWTNKCAEWCFHIYEPERFGDQKYLMKFPLLFKGVHELQHLGGCVAPWNLKQYKLVSENPVVLIEKVSELKGTDEFELILYHFQNLRFISSKYVNVSSEIHNKRLKDVVYKPYLREMVEIRKKLAENYGMEFEIKKKNSSNKLIALLQGSILRFKVRSISDIYNLEKV